jgi:hypothetical protein
MVKAKDLVKKQKEREELKKNTYDKIYKIIEKKICTSSDSNCYHIWYQVPEFLVGLPVYSYTHCKEYLINKLISNGFNVSSYEPNILFIKWFDEN